MKKIKHFSFSPHVNENDFIKAIIIVHNDRDNKIIVENLINHSTQPFSLDEDGNINKPTPSAPNTSPLADANCYALGPLQEGENFSDCFKRN